MPRIGWIMVFAVGAGLFQAGCAADPDGQITRTTFLEVKTLVPGDLASMDEFGGRVDMDGNDVAVGACYNDVAGQDRGAVYIFSRDHGGTDAWGEVKKVTASDAEDMDRFGYAFDLEGDILAVQSSREIVYIFYRDQGGPDNWGEVTKIGERVPDSGFGWALALSGNCLIVGARMENEGGYSRGAAYVFYKDQGGSDAWGQVARLTAADAYDFGCFGTSVAVAGDTAVIGAVGMNIDDTGAAYIFSRNLGGPDAWGQVAKIAANDAQPQDQFGIAVDIFGDTVIVGAPCEDGQAGIGDNPGAAYVFSRNQGGADAWGQVRKLTNGSGGGSFFGISAGLSGDFLVLGALYSGGPGLSPDFGAVYFFSRNEGGTDGWGLLNSANATDGEALDFLGMSVSLFGDYAVAGASSKDRAGMNSGAAYVFKRTTQSVSPLKAAS